MKLLIPYNNDVRLLEGSYDTILLAHKDLSSHSVITDNILETIDLIHTHDKKAYMNINRFLFEPEIENATTIIKEMIKGNIDGFVVNDFGLLIILKRLGFTGDIVLNTDTTMTNHKEIMALVEEGFKQVVIARELTIDEIIELSNTLKEMIIVPIFGHQIISTSRRALLSAYGAQVNKTYHQNHIYKLRESTRDDYFLGIEDATGLHIFDEKVLNGFSELPTLLENNASSFLMDSFGLETEVLLLADSLLRQLENKEITNEEAEEKFMSAYPNITLTQALWHTKTTDKKEY